MTEQSAHAVLALLLAATALVYLLSGEFLHALLALSETGAYAALSRRTAEPPQPPEPEPPPIVPQEGTDTEK